MVDHDENDMMIISGQYALCYISGMHGAELLGHGAGWAKGKIHGAGRGRAKKCVNQLICE